MVQLTAAIGQRGVRAGAALQLRAAPARRHAVVRYSKRSIGPCRAAAQGGDAAPGAGSPGSEPATSAAAAAASPAAPAEPVKRNLWQKVKHFFVGDKLDKERLAALGVSAFASYSAISNVTYGICLVVAWTAFVRTTGNSPLWEGQWSGFLAFYAGLWTLQNFVRPLRFSLALALAPLFNTFIENIAAATGLDKKWAFGILLVGIAICTTATLGTALWALGGFPAKPV